MFFFIKINTFIYLFYILINIIIYLYLLHIFILCKFIDVLINATQQNLSDKNSNDEILNTEKMNFNEKKRYYKFDNIKGLLMFIIY